MKSNYIYTNLTTRAEDALNRIQSVTYDLTGPRDTSQTIYAAYNVSYEYVPTGDKAHIKKVTTAGLQMKDYAYDIEGRVQDYTQTITGRESYPMITSYLYDTLDRITDVRYPAQYGYGRQSEKIGSAHLRHSEPIINSEIR